MEAKLLKQPAAAAGAQTAALETPAPDTNNRWY
jgi:hypothetical protein